MLIIEGKIQKEDGCIDVIARHVWPFNGSGIGNAIHARNFH